MRLYLASDVLGDFSQELIKLVGDNRKTLFITNARDYKTPEARLESVGGDIKSFTEAGLDVTELDLKSYFNKPDKLRDYVQTFNPGLVFCAGGNLFLLSTALKKSGMDDIIREGLASDRFVYGGYSAGSMSASKDLTNYNDSYGTNKVDRYAEAMGTYGEVCTDGLGIIDEYVCPHADRDKFANSCTKAIKILTERSLTPIALSDPEVYVVNGIAKQTYK